MESNFKNTITIINELKKNDFKKTIDKIGTYCTNNDLYYKFLRGNNYLVFNHFGTQYKDTEKQGFDFWISEYNSEDAIGNKTPIKCNDLRLGFNFERDKELLIKHLN